MPTNWPYWTNLSSVSLKQKLSKTCKIKLISIAKILQEVNSLIRNEVKLNQEYFDQLSRDRTYYNIRQTKFDALDVSNLEYWMSFQFPGLDDESDADFTDPLVKKLLAFLVESSYSRIWKTAVLSLLEYEGEAGPFASLSWTLGRERALNVLELRDEILGIFEDIQKELKGNDLEAVRNGIIDKIKKLERFSAAYNRQASSLEDKPYYEVRPIGAAKEENNASVFEAYPRDQQNRNSTVIAIVSAVTVASMVPMIFAWQRSSNSTGSTADVDFWLLIQTSVLQLLGLFTTIYPMPKHSTATAWLWAIVFTVLGSVCVFAAIPVYLYISTMWSAFSSFIGSAAQLSMTLQLALIADSRFTPVKEE